MYIINIYIYRSRIYTFHSDIFDIGLVNNLLMHFAEKSNPESKRRLAGLVMKVVL